MNISHARRGMIEQKMLEQSKRWCQKTKFTAADMSPERLASYFIYHSTIPYQDLVTIAKELKAKLKMLELLE